MTAASHTSSATTDYQTARSDLRDAELALMQQRESVAAMRRALPLGPVADDHTFVTSDGPGTEDGEAVTLDQLVGDRPLVLYHFMFGDTMTEPCPMCSMCSMWADGWSGIVDHVEQNVDFALVTNATAEQNHALAAANGWQSLRWLSAADTSFKRDYGSADADGNQSPVVTVFERVDGRVHLSYDGAAHSSGEHWRGVDLLSPVWHLLDLTRSGRGDFMPQRRYR